MNHLAFWAITVITFTLSRVTGSAFMELSVTLTFVMSMEKTIKTVVIWMQKILHSALTKHNNSSFHSNMCLLPKCLSIREWSLTVVSKSTVGAARCDFNFFPWTLQPPCPSGPLQITQLDASLLAVVNVHLRDQAAIEFYRKFTKKLRRWSWIDGITFFIFFNFHDQSIHENVIYRPFESRKNYNIWCYYIWDIVCNVPSLSNSCL